MEGIMTTKTAHTAGAERAGREIAARFRKHLQFLPASTDDTLAEIIDKETGAPEMLEALELIHDKLAGTFQTGFRFCFDDCSKHGLQQHSPACQAIDKALSTVEAAIQKAGGGQRHDTKTKL
jgi:hypothetical protein